MCRWRFELSDHYRRISFYGQTFRHGPPCPIDFRLEVGKLTEQVTVEAATPLLNVVTNTLGQVIENRRIVDLPLEAREPFSLAALTPGVIPIPPPIRTQVLLEVLDGILVVIGQHEPAGDRFG